MAALLSAEAGIDDRRLYDGSRHTVGTILNELGVDMPRLGLEERDLPYAVGVSGRHTAHPADARPVQPL
nr:hypothetical protein [Streptomyces cellulosae]